MLLTTIRGEVMKTISLTAEKTTMHRDWLCVDCGYAQSGVLSYYEWKKAWELHRVAHYAMSVADAKISL